jgi:3'(2'), 5'-bisphosphate nucleotidase
MNSYSHELHIAQQLAKAAGAIILDKRTEALKNIQEKADNEGPVTEADLAADAYISAGLTKAFPNDTLITEETWPSSAEPLPQDERMWIVDPLDGTSDFSRGGSDYVVMIGLCVAGQPTVGVVYHPVSQTCWSGVTGAHGDSQAFQTYQGQQRSLQTRHFDDAQPRALISRSHPSKIIDQLLTDLGLNDRLTRGSVGLKAGAIAHGEADVYLTATHKIKVWDTCAPQAILEAAGARITSLLGEPLRYDQKAAHPDGICAASADAFSYFQPMIKSLWEKRHLSKD